MPRPGDVSFGAAYSSELLVSVIYRDLAGVPFDVTGYTARLEISTYDGSLHGAMRLDYASAFAQITVGTTDGLFVATLPGADLLFLAQWCSNPPGVEPAQFRFWVTPPAGAEFEIVHGSIRLYEAGVAVSNPVLDVTEDDYTATVTAIGARGSTGSAGANGATGATGSAGANGATGATGASGGAGTAGIVQGFSTSLYSPVAVWNFNGNLTEEITNIGTSHLNGGYFAEMHPGKRGLFLNSANYSRTNAANAILRLTGDMTLVAMYRCEVAPNGQAIIEHGNSGESADTNVLYSLSTTSGVPRRLSFFSESGAGVNATYATSGVESMPGVGAAVQVAFTRISNRVQMYMNGVTFGSLSSALTAPTDGSTGLLFFGCGVGATAVADSILGGFAIYNAGLSAAEMKNLYNTTMGAGFGQIP